MSQATAGGPLFVVTGKPGQLGNRLFFFSYVLALAMKLGGRVANPGFIDYAESFAAIHDDPLSRWPARWALFRGKWFGQMIYAVQTFVLRVVNRLRLPLPGIKILHLDETRTADFRLDHAPFLDSLRSARIVFVGGWLELRHVCFEQPEKIRTHFAPIERHRAAVESLITRARANCAVLIGVHIRQGDYAGFLGGRYFFSTEVYLRVMHRAAALFPGRQVGFLICSHLPQHIPDPAPGLVMHGTGQVIEDLYALAECDYLIGPPSTFSLWASFYGQKPLWELHDAASEPKLDEFLIRF